MAKRLIDAEAVEQYPIRRDNYDKENGNINFINGVESVLEYVNELPTIEAKPVVHAHWEVKKYQAPFDEDLHYQMICSNCGNNYCSDEIFFTNYCHKCGAQMDEVATDINVGSKINATTTGVKIPVISMEDVPKIAKEMEK